MLILLSDPALWLAHQLFCSLTQRFGWHINYESRHLNLRRQSPVDAIEAHGLAPRSFNTIVGKPRILSINGHRI